MLGVATHQARRMAGPEVIIWGRIKVQGGGSKSWPCTENEKYG